MTGPHAMVQITRNGHYRWRCTGRQGSVGKGATRVDAMVAYAMRREASGDVGELWPVMSESACPPDQMFMFTKDRFGRIMSVVKVINIGTGEVV